MKPNRNFKDNILRKYSKKVIAMELEQILSEMGVSSYNSCEKVNGGKDSQV
ncbi:hypothetical protein [Rossellomorea sp. BNER]|uniref:hypothetical protein n=1 Tax=Rossellomorea sp. BNER TaxID=2962031 RepID=UPI003AF2B016|nr:hypothetical protein [Rossellomorea sp. BNER]